MSIVVRLALADMRRKPGRLAVTTLAIVASSTAVVWVVSGYDALVEKVGEVGEEYLGRYDAHLSAPDVSASIAALREDPDVAGVEPITQVRAAIFPASRVEPVAPSETEADGGADADDAADGYGGEGAYIDGDGSGRRRRVSERLPIIVATSALTPPRAMVEGAWLAAPGAELEGVLSSGLAARLGVAAGGSVVARAWGRPEVRVRVVGVVQETIGAAITGETVAGPGGTLDASRGAGPAGAALYVRPDALGALGAQAPPDLASIVLRRGSDDAAFRERWAARLPAGGRLVTPDDLRDALSQSSTTRAARAQSYAATGVSLLAALFIIFSTLSMGVTERMRQLAVLRAVALTRAQVARLVGVEALVLAGLGWLGGLAAGWALLALAARAQPEMFPRGIGVGHGGQSIGPGGWSAALSFVVAFVGALLAAIGPAWTAARVDIVAALGERPALPSPRRLAAAALVGAALVLISPLVLLVLPLADRPRAILFGAAGAPGLAIGWLLLCPGLVVLVERALGPLLARALALPPTLLRAQLATNLGRTVGTAVALTVGLGLFVTIQVSGRSMLGPFLPGAWAPDALISFTAPLSPRDLDDVALLPGVVRVVPLATEQPRLADDITGSRERGQSVVRQDNVIFVGCDPELALFDLTFVQGQREDALAKLRDGRYVIVPDSFARATGLGLGGALRVVPPASPTTTVEYTIAGVVTLPGWHFVTKTAGLRRRLPRAAALLFASEADVRRDFHQFDRSRVDLLALELAPGVDEAALRAGLEPVVARTQAQRAGGVSIMTPAAVRDTLQSRTDAILWGASELPLITLLVTALGVVNAIVASVRARRWELGVLRAIGVTRSALARMVLAEAALVGVVACALSLAFGLSASWGCVTVAQSVSFFGGLAPPMVVPWAQLGLGVGACLAACLAAGLWPAISIGRADPLELLQGGRDAR